jgi:hypothetical protein
MIEYTTRKVNRALRAAVFGGAALAFGSASAGAAESFVPENGTIGYIATDFHWAVYLTENHKEECADGLNPWGPREQFKALYPDDGTKRTAVDTHLAFEIAQWFPDADTPDRFPFYEVTGKKSYGLNLDGRVDENDFISPDGVPGIDNELYRVVGCVVNLRPPEGPTAFYANKAVMEERWNRVLLEIKGVDSLENDDEVEVTMLRGLDNLLTDATGSKYVAGGSMRVDAKWGNKFVQHFKGKIVDGTLITEPVSFGILPWSSFQTPTEQKFHDMRFQLKLAPDAAVGYIGGFVDVENWYWQTVKSESTHHQSYGQSTPSSIYKALRKRADAYPDPKTGRNTAISAALEAKFVQTFIIHPPGGPVAALEGPREVAPSPSASGTARE